MSTTRRGRSRKRDKRPIELVRTETSPPTGDGTRIAKALAHLGFCSRRDAERLIAGGHVQVNGNRVEHPSTLVDLAHDRLSVDGQPVRTDAPPRYVALHKPRGVVSTVRDRHAERTVVELVPGAERLYPVGRLDKESEGLILLTNDGEFSNLVTHPRYETDKEYLALVNDFPSPRALSQLRRGVELDGQRTAPARVEVQRRTPEGVWLRLVLHEGRNREVRRMLGAVGSTAERLIRSRIGPIRLGELRPGQHRELRDDEIQDLRSAAEEALARAARAAEPARGTGVFAAPGPSRRRREVAGSEGTEADAPPIQAQERDGVEVDVGFPAGSHVSPRDAQLVVAIDGPSGAGKTTVGALVAEQLGAVFLDTGVLYRALTLRALQDDVAMDDEDRLSEIARGLDVHVRRAHRADGRDYDVLLGGQDITDAIHSAEVDGRVAQVAGLRSVRAALVPAQRGAVRGPRAVVVGRDIGTVIFPDATVKIFLDASIDERATRRARQQGVESDPEATRRALIQRDTLDRGRTFAPLARADNAVVIDTDGASVDEVVDRVYNLVLERGGTDA